MFNLVHFSPMMTINRYSLDNFRRRKLINSMIAFQWHSAILMPIELLTFSVEILWGIKFKWCWMMIVHPHQKNNVLSPFRMCEHLWIASIHFGFSSRGLLYDALAGDYDGDSKLDLFILYKINSEQTMYNGGFLWGDREQLSNDWMFVELGIFEWCFRWSTTDRLLFSDNTDDTRVNKRGRFFIFRSVVVFLQCKWWFICRFTGNDRYGSTFSRTSLFNFVSEKDLLWFRKKEMISCFSFNRTVKAYNILTNIDNLLPGATQATADLDGDLVPGPFNYQVLTFDSNLLFISRSIPYNQQQQPTEISHLSITDFWHDIDYRVRSTEWYDPVSSIDICWYW